MQVRWTEQAIADIQSLRAYIEKDKPQAAKKIVLRIISIVENDLLLQPGMGRPGRKPGTRELIISGTPYFIPYRIKDNWLEIIRVLHGAMKWP
ncbi:MAG: type II toxin-antitoxin system RelE/ParE family toxin [Thermodesulfobacteriota bacterium]|nr:type II toxin-antitoxin system RelE/ParE family toxin [Thermodesulfobacteriota bacterium]